MNKNFWFAAMSLLIFGGSVSDIFAQAVMQVRGRQRFPWSKAVDIDYTLSEVSDPGSVVVQIRARDQISGETILLAPEALSGPLPASNGTHRVTWDPQSQGVALESSEVIYSVSLHPSAPNYYVIDLTGGSEAASYPVSRLSEMPAGGWTDEYKTNKLVLKKIPAGSFVMGSPTNELGRAPFEKQHEVVLTRDYYMGVFEVTQAQWFKVMGTSPSQQVGPDRPVESVSYQDIRGGSAGSTWPDSSTVDPDTFLGRLRSRTGVKTVDFPTEAQWEYACRAGTGTSLNSGKEITQAWEACPNMDQVGRYMGNYLDGKGNPAYNNYHTAVGQYRPNAWGLYDMHGNVCEWCLDWYAEDYGSAAADPRGPRTGDYRVLRGGGFTHSAASCRSASREFFIPSGRAWYYGFRLAMAADALSSESDGASAELARGDSAPTALSNWTEPILLMPDRPVSFVTPDWWEPMGDSSVTFMTNGVPIGSAPSGDLFAWTPPAGAWLLTLSCSDGTHSDDAAIRVWEPLAVQDVRACQRYPWDNRVDIDYTVTGVLDETDLSIRIEARDPSTHILLASEALSSVPSVSRGRHRVTWNPVSQGVTHGSTNLVYTVALYAPEVTCLAHSPQSRGSLGTAPRLIAQAASAPTLLAKWTGDLQVPAGGKLPLTYSDRWDGVPGGTILLTANGEAFGPTSGEGVTVWTAPAQPQRLCLAHREGGVETRVNVLVTGKIGLSVISPIGDVLPPVGSNLIEIASSVTASAPACVQVSSGERGFCTGWTGTGSVPAIGSGTNLNFTLEMPSTLTWKWRTEYLLAASVSGSGRVTPSAAWVAKGGMQVFTASPGPNSRWAGWAGDLSGCTTNGPSITIPADHPRAVSARFESAIRVESVKSRQRFPWKRLVDLDYTVSGVDTPDGLSVRILGREESRGTNFVIHATHPAPPAVSGTHRTTWDPLADGITFESENLVYTILILSPEGEVLSQNDSAPSRLRQWSDELRVAPGDELPLAYSDRWDGVPGGEITLAADGEVFASQTGEGEEMWTVPGDRAQLTLTHTDGDRVDQILLRIWEPELTLSIGKWGKGKLTTSAGETTLPGGSTHALQVPFGSDVSLSFLPDAGFGVREISAGGAAYTTNLVLHLQSVESNQAFSVQFQPQPETRIRWKLARSTGLYYAQITFPWYDGYGEAMGNLRFLFPDRTDSAGIIYAQLRKGVDAADLLSTFGAAAYRGVTLQQGALSGYAANDRVAFGVRDTTFEASETGVPADERAIALYVRQLARPEQGNEAAANVGNFIGYLAWETGGAWLYQAVGERYPLGPVAARPIGVAALNLAHSLGISPVILRAGDLPTPHLRLTDFALSPDGAQGRFALSLGDEKRAVLQGIPRTRDQLRLWTADTPAGPWREVTGVTWDDASGFIVPPDDRPHAFYRVTFKPRQTFE